MICKNPNKCKVQCNIYHSEEAKLSHALRNINRRHFLPITKGFSNKRQWDFATSQQILFRTSFSTMILFTTLFHTSRQVFRTSRSLYWQHDVEYETVFSVKYEISILHLHSQIAFITPDYDTLIFLQHLIGKNIGLQYSHCKSVRKSHHENVVNYETFGVTQFRFLTVILMS